VQIPCASGPATALEFGRDSWVVRWAGGANTPAGLVNDTIAEQPLTAWRSMREVKLDLQQPAMQALLVRNRSNSESRQVNVRIEPAANQYNFRCVTPGSLRFDTRAAFAATRANRSAR
jgi:hypothetical protein